MHRAPYLRIGILVGALACCAHPMRADVIYLDWNDCPTAPAASGDFTGACQNAGFEELFVSFELSEAVDSVIGLEALVDVRSAAATLPAWWHYEPEGCRYRQLQDSAVFSDRSTCADFWAGDATPGGPPVYSVGVPDGGLNQARITLSFAVPSSTPRALAAGTRYYAARLRFQNDPSNACAGCEEPACIVLSSILLARVPGAAGGDRLMESTGSPDANQVTWQTAGAGCQTVPVLRPTWGRLKALYR